MALTKDFSNWFRTKIRDDIRSPGTRLEPPFGTPLQLNRGRFNATIYLSGHDGNPYVYGHIPIIIEECGNFLKGEGTNFPGVFSALSGGPRLDELKLAFSSSPFYGRGIDWTRYSVNDARFVMLLYLEQLPEPVIPFRYHTRFCEPLRNVRTFSISNGSFDSEKAVGLYQDLIAELPPINRHVLLYILDILALYTVKASELAALFQPGLLKARGIKRRDLIETRLSQKVLTFLVDNQASFPLGLPGTALYDESHDSLGPLDRVHCAR